MAVNKIYKHHFIYKTTNILNQKYYIGMHSTDNLKDGYLGSGKIIKASIKKYGKENFKFEILFELPDRKSLKEKEREVVNREEVNNKLCMNLQLGGFGGLTTPEHAYKFHAAGGRAVRQILNKRHTERLKSDQEYRTKWYEAVVKGCKEKGPSFLGKKHKEETIQKMKEVRRGTGCGTSNSQYGSFWITDGVINKKIKKDQSIPTGFGKGRVTK